MYTHKNHKKLIFAVECLPVQPARLRITCLAKKWLYIAVKLNVQY